MGQEFPVHVYLDNPKQKPFDVISFALSYDPKLLEFVDAPGGDPAVHNSHDRSEKILGGIPLARDEREDPFYLNRADPKEGMVYYRARCASGETTVGQGFLLTMKFRALQPILHTGLRFRFSDWPESLAPLEQSDQSWIWPKTMTFVAKSPSSTGGQGKWENLLGSEGTEADGVISGGLTVHGDHLQALAEEEEKAPKGETGTRIVLEPRVAVVQSGKPVDLNIRLFNPREIPWDRIRVDLEFDPRYLTVEDQDSGNWITRGTNLLDGPYHDRFPFEWMRNNLVRQKEGRILYECGVLTKPLRVEGIVATLRLRALRPVPETKISFRVPGEVTWRDGTVLTRKRADRLANTEDPQDGVGGAIISIVPRRASDETGSLADVRAK
ncbi:MAG: hypothetical protein GHCLOJNM_03282 [bacterium]|nr:hypothetical protein [bacterium]